MNEHIGNQVVHVHRIGQTGTLTAILEGANTLWGVVWEGRDYISWMPPQDIALKDSDTVSRV